MGTVQVAYSCFITHSIYWLIPLSTHPIVLQPSDKTPVTEHFVSFIEVDQQYFSPDTDIHIVNQVLDKARELDFKGSHISKAIFQWIKKSTFWVMARPTIELDMILCKNFHEIYASETARSLTAGFVLRPFNAGAAFQFGYITFY